MGAQWFSSRTACQHWKGSPSRIGWGRRARMNIGLHLDGALWEGKTNLHLRAPDSWTVANGKDDATHFKRCFSDGRTPRRELVNGKSMNLWHIGGGDFCCPCTPKLYPYKPHTRVFLFGCCTVQMKPIHVY